MTLQITENQLNVTANLNSIEDEFIASVKRLNVNSYGELNNPEHRAHVITALLAFMAFDTDFIKFKFQNDDADTEIHQVIQNTARRLVNYINEVIVVNIETSVKKLENMLLQRHELEAGKLSALQLLSTGIRGLTKEEIDYVTSGTKITLYR